MANIFDYLKWRGDLCFSQDPPNEVDALVFSGLSYIRFGAVAEHYPQQPVSLKEAAEAFFALEGYETCCRVEKDLELLRAATQTRRFGEIKLCMYRDLLIPEQETQFAAMHLLFLFVQSRSFFFPYAQRK